MKKIPVCIITGFLGSGKTSLLNNIIKKNSSKKIVIIENEFGEKNIDKDLITTSAGNSVYELTNGCICCSIKNELGTTLNSLILSQKPYDLLIIETTGIADPGDIVKTFIAGERVQRYFELDTVICVVDAKNYNSQKKENPEVDKQMLFANSILINKADLVDKNKLVALRNELKAEYEGNIFTVQHAGIDELDLIGQKHFSPDFIKKEVTTFKNLQLNLPHKHNISSILIRLDGSFKTALFSLWIEQFLQLNSSIYRMKGIISVDDSDNKIVVQAVKEVIDIYEAEPWDKGQRECSLIFIGKDINREDISEALQNLLVT